MKDLYKKKINVHIEAHFQLLCFCCILIMQNVLNPKHFSSVLQELPEILLQCEAKTKRTDCLVRKKYKQPFCLSSYAENTSLPNAQLGPEQNIFLFVHLTPSSVCCLARLSLMHLFVGVRKKNTCISPSQPFCSEVLPSRTGQMWGTGSAVDNSITLLTHPSV